MPKTIHQIEKDAQWVRDVLVIEVDAIAEGRSVNMERLHMSLGRLSAIQDAAYDIGKQLRDLVD